MKKIILSAIMATGILASARADLLISQYFEGPGGTGNSKALEIWNSGTEDLVFSESFVLQIQKDVNSNGTFSDIFTITSGTLAAGSVWVFSNTDTTFSSLLSSAGIAVQDSSTNVNFNGDDEIRLVLNGTVTDLFGLPPDPGTAWTGNGVSTADMNIQLLAGITTGNPSGFTDPSTRFEIASTLANPITTSMLVGLGVAPVPEPGTVALIGLGLGAVLFGVRRQRKA